MAKRKKGSGGLAAGTGENPKARTPKKAPAAAESAPAEEAEDDAPNDETDAADATKPPIGGAVGALERLDSALGTVELCAAGFFVVALALVATYQFVVVTLLGGLVESADELIRYLVFFTAMAGAAFAAQQRRMMAIDFVPRLLSPKVRTMVRIVLALFVAAMCVLIVYGGIRTRQNELALNRTALLALPIGGGLIGLHFLLQALIDAGYLLSGRLPPEQAEAVH